MNRKDKLTVFSLSFGHFINDSYSNFLPPLIPFLVVRLKLTMAEAGWLAAILVISSSFTQPVYGYISDRYSKRVFAVFSPLVTAVFMSCLGLATSYTFLAVLLLLGGIGIASFHPQGAAITTMSSGSRKGLGMSIFITSGTLGYSLGPILITFAVAQLGLDRSYLVVLPGLLAFGMLYFFVPAIEPLHRSGPRAILRDALTKSWQPMLILYWLVVIRSAVQMCLVSFLPLYLQQRGIDTVRAAEITSIFLFAGAIGGFSGGTLADRFGGKVVISLSMILSTPCFVAFLLSQGLSSYVWLALGGVVLLSTIPVNVVLAQELIPENASMASALTMGFAWGMGGMAVPLIGKVADHAGLEQALMLVIALPVGGFLLSLALPNRSTNKNEPSNLETRLRNATVREER